MPDLISLNRQDLFAAGRNGDRHHRSFVIEFGYLASRLRVEKPHCVFYGFWLARRRRNKFTVLTESDFTNFRLVIFIPPNGFVSFDIPQNSDWLKRRVGVLPSHNPGKSK